jgi:hypothetical protein
VLHQESFHFPRICQELELHKMMITLICSLLRATFR